ncbi:MAG: TetR/AcrR family transcriptional regulator [Flavobacterium sp.]|nr:TetR/AcrR family transcriptional regulator [Flavobacterium sp.]
MNVVLPNIVINISKKLYIKNPETSYLGKKIIENSILLIDEIGFENFTFKKLGEKISSNESSIYRYFDSKHKLLLYLSAWYWGWMDYKLIFATNNIANAIEKLKIAVQLVTEEVVDDTDTLHVNEAVLYKIIVSEFAKTLLTKDVDQENEIGYFLVYKKVINRLQSFIDAVNPKYPFAKTLASSIVEGALHQHFLKNHFKTITNCNETISPTDFYINLIDNTLK